MAGETIRSMVFVQIAFLFILYMFKYNKLGIFAPHIVMVDELILILMYKEIVFLDNFRSNLILTVNGFFKG